MTATPDRSPVAELRPVLPPIKCASWCIHQDGHPDLRHVGDQRCETEEHRTYLHQPIDRREYECVTAYVERQGAHAKPNLHLGFDGMSGVDLTPREARHLARHLRRLAMLAELPESLVHRSP